MENKILNALMEQRKEKGLKSLYWWTQVSFAYNSNKIEGSKLTEEQTELIYETNNLYFNENKDAIKIDDVIEMANHFRLFNLMLDTYDQPLSKELILNYHRALKNGTSQSYDPIYNVGGYKKKPNIIGIVNIINTSKPEDVEQDMNSLLSEYNSLTDVNFEDIVDFHYRFETIHPLSDGNGRIGRMIMFKECLKNDIVPFVVLDQYRAEYINGLNKYKKPSERNYLIDTCLLFQDNYKYVCDQTIGTGFSAESSI